MKVGYIAPMSIAAVQGGIKTQAMFTIKHLAEIGIQPVKLTPWDNISKIDLDLIHVFGATIENIGVMERISTGRIPVVLSPVFYSNQNASVIKLSRTLDKVTKLIGSGIRSDFTIKARLCELADVVLPNTKSEAKLIQKGFSIAQENIKVIPNGVERRFKNATPEIFQSKYDIKDFILFVGQAGAPRKNVIKLLEIAPRFQQQVIIIGSFYDDDYGKQCQKLAHNAENITLIDTLDHDSDILASAYAASQVFVLPSQYETPGIAALEAGLAGSKIVITKHGGTKDYFDDYAEYINPKSSESLYMGIQNAINDTNKDPLAEYILSNYTWDKVAELTKNVYNSVLA